MPDQNLVIHFATAKELFMEKKSVTIVLFATLVLMASGQDEIRDASTHDHPTEASMSAHHGSDAGRAVFEPEFENESVQVVRITIGPHAKLPMHDLTARVVVLLTDQNLRLTFPNGETREEHHKAGETMWVSVQRPAGKISLTSPSNSLRYSATQMKGPYTSLRILYGLEYSF